MEVRGKKRGRKEKKGRPKRRREGNRETGWNPLGIKSGSQWISWVFLSHRGGKTNINHLEHFTHKGPPKRQGRSAGREDDAGLDN